MPIKAGINQSFLYVEAEEYSRKVVLHGHKPNLRAELLILPGCISNKTLAKSNCGAHKPIGCLWEGRQAAEGVEF